MNVIKREIAVFHKFNAENHCYLMKLTCNHNDCYCKVFCSLDIAWKSELNSENVNFLFRIYGKILYALNDKSFNACQLECANINGAGQTC